MSSFTTYIAGLHKQLGNNTAPNGHGSTTSSPHPPASTHDLPSHSPLPSTPSSGGLVLLPSQPLTSGTVVPLPTQNTGNPHLLHISNSSVPSASMSHRSQIPSSNISPISVTPGHSTCSSSQPITTSYHKSLRRILSQDQDISTSPRKLRSRYIQTTSGQLAIPHS